MISRQIRMMSTKAGAKAKVAVIGTRARPRRRQN